jgi:hypothetical protein
MANSEAAVDWAAAHGANGVEVDLRFDDTGKPLEFRHGGVCDCFCAFGQESICSALRTSGAACEASAAPAALLGRISQRIEIALVILDSKVSGLSAPISEVAGQEVVRLIESRLFGSGYSGNVVVSAADFKSSAYLRAAAVALQGKPFVDKVFLTFDQEGNRAAQVLTAIRDLPSRARAFGTGISACGLGDFRRGIRIAEDNRSKGSASFVYIWTLDSASSMRRYTRDGAQGVITNFPSRLRKVIEGEGGKLATRATSLPLATSDEIVDSSR